MVVTITDYHAVVFDFECAIFKRRYFGQPCLCEEIRYIGASPQYSVTNTIFVSIGARAKEKISLLLGHGFKPVICTIWAAQFSHAQVLGRGSCQKMMRPCVFDRRDNGADSGNMKPLKMLE
jgi:hypothetical protein